jgi:hypothetical protein
VSLLLRLERRLEAIFEGMFARWARDRVHPAEIGRRVLREMDRGAVAGVGGLLLPNDYHVFLHPGDFSPYAAYTGPLVEEITASLRARAEELGGRLGGPVRVELSSREEIARGEIYIEARLLPAAPNAEGPPVAGGTPENTGEPGASRGAPGGDTRVYRRPGSRRLRVRAGAVGQADREFLLDQPITTIGRRSDQDIVLDDPSVSRTHARIEINAEGVAIADLGSTNGTLVNTRSVRAARVPLRSGDRIKIGAVLLEYLAEP